jgi:hypothetical protein
MRTISSTLAGLLGACLVSPYLLAESTPWQLHAGVQQLHVMLGLAVADYAYTPAQPKPSSSACSCQSPLR